MKVLRLRHEKSCGKSLVLFTFISIINTLTCLSAVYMDRSVNSVNDTLLNDEPPHEQAVNLTDIPQPQSLKHTGRGHAENEISIQKVCTPQDGEDTLVCSGRVWKDELMEAQTNFRHVSRLVFVNLTMNDVESEGLELQDLQLIFPTLRFLHIVNNTMENIKRLLGSFPSTKSNTTGAESMTRSSTEREYESLPAFLPSQTTGIAGWESVETLDLSGNHIESAWIPGSLVRAFPNLRALSLSRNNISDLDMLDRADLKRLESVDLSENPLDCTKNLDWIEETRLENAEETVCALPAHQNKPKPILKVYPLVKEVREECRLNCSCFVEYIWEQGKEIHSKTAVNCSHRNLRDFPDPDLMPHRTDTLYLNHNEIQSLESFAGNDRWQTLGLMNLYLNDNKITSISPLEGSDWLYDFQILSLRNNQLTEAPMYILENAMRQNRRLYFVDISNNPWNCDCHTVTTLKIWLLRYSTFMRNIEEVRCGETHEQVRHMKIEEWCQTDEIPIVEILDLVSITLAFLIVIIICKVYYDYWNYKRNGRLPWLVRKM